MLHDLILMTLHGGQKKHIKKFLRKKLYKFLKYLVQFLDILLVFAFIASRKYGSLYRGKRCEQIWSPYMHMLTEHP